MSFRRFPNKDTATVYAWLTGEAGRELLANLDTSAYVGSMMNEDRERYIVNARAEALRQSLSRLVLVETRQGTLVHDMLLNALEHVDWWFLDDAINDSRG